MGKAMFNKSNKQIQITVPKYVVDAVNIEEGDGVRFIPGFDMNGNSAYCLVIDKGKYIEKRRRL